jgi:dipeptidyl aminopeptidase/acylaminoacyl peptidase
MKQLLVIISAIATISTSSAQNQSALTIDQIMQGEGFVGYLPSSIRWTEDSQNITFTWNPDQDTLRSRYRVNPSDKEITKLSPEELKKIATSGDYSGDYSRKVFSKNGDLFLTDLSSFETKQITSTITRESNPIFADDDSEIVYEMDDNLFSWNITDGSTRQITNFQSGSKRKQSRASEQDQWLEQDQLTYFEMLQKRKDETDARKYRRELTDPDRPEAIYYGSKTLGQMSISPDLKYVVYVLIEEADQKRTIVPDYTTQSGYTKDLNARPKVGSERDKYETWVLDLSSQKAMQIKTEDIEGIYNKPNYLKDYLKPGEELVELYANPREVYIGLPVYSEEGKAIVNITAQDYKDRWIMALELETATLKLIDRQHDDAWIAGDGIGWFSRPAMGWIDENSIWFLSEKTGYGHLYTANINSGKIKALTRGEFEINEVQLSRDKRTFFITSNKVSPHEKHFYHMPVSGGKMTQITQSKGGHQVTLSPDESQLAIRFGYTNKPWELYVMPNEAGAEMVQLTHSTTEDFKAYPWLDAPIIQFEASDGAMVPATLYEPEEGKKNGAAVIFVHGAGYTQNVHYWWPGYYREYMFHNFLRDNGYTVLAIDFRASKGYGRDWRTAIYRHMGGRDLADQVDGANYLVEELGIDANRIGIYGGSYGGFITLMAMFNESETFASGAALRSVTDWAHYNHGYTANILNTPVADSLSFARSSPIYFAEGLKGNLLMLHGMIDRNVHFQDVVRLSQRLIELKKENWELAVFPLEGHGFVESSSWSDEYRRIYKLFEETLR